MGLLVQIKQWFMYSSRAQIISVKYSLSLPGMSKQFRIKKNNFSSQAFFEWLKSKKTFLK